MLKADITAAHEGVLGRLVSTAMQIFAPRVEGFVDRIIAEEVVGWAVDGRRPGRRVLIVARLEGRIVGEALADLVRRDVESLGKGDGRCGFRLKTPSGLSEAQQAALIIEANLGWRSVPLRRAKRFKARPQAEADPTEMRPRGPVAGFLERCTGAALKGWAVDPSNPEEVPFVDIFNGETYLGSAAANIERPRLHEAGAPFGARGFEFELPRDRRIRPNALRARITGTRTDLRYSRSYPGEGFAEPSERAVEASLEEVMNASDTATSQSPHTTARRPLAFLICGTGEGIAATAQSLQAQTGGPFPIAALDDTCDPSLSVEMVHTKTPGALLKLFDQTVWVCLLSAGQRARPVLAERLLSQTRSADVLSWNAEGRRPTDAAIDLALALGCRSNGLAARGAVLSRVLEAEGVGIFRTGGRAVDAALVRANLAWGLIAEELASAPADHAPGGWPVTPSLPRRVSLALWDGFIDDDRRLESLLVALAPFVVEVLIPSAAAPQAQERLQRLCSRTQASIRLVDAPQTLDQNGLRFAMGRAATGQVVMFYHGAVEVPPASVNALVGWAHDFRSGAAALPLADEQGRIVAGRSPGGQAGAGAGAGDRLIDAAPPLLAAVSRRAFALSAGVGETQPADLNGWISPYQQQSGHRCVLLNAWQATAPGSVLEPWTFRHERSATGRS